MSDVVSGLYAEGCGIVPGELVFLLATRDVHGLDAIISRNRISRHEYLASGW